MGIEEIRSRISVINAETSRINIQRNQNIGRQEALKKQLADACAMYKQKYGVDITQDNVKSELDSLTSKKEAELNKIEQILSLIHAGNIAEANRLAGIEVVDASHMQNEVTQSAMDGMSSQPQSFERQKSSASNFATSYESVATPPVQPVQSVVTQPADSYVASPVSAPPVTPPPVAAPPMFNSQETQKSKPVMTGAESLDLGMPALEGFTKPSLGSVAPPPVRNNTDSVAAPPKSGIKDFGAILSGTAFKPQ